jgi:hypothetical protein
MECFRAFFPQMNHRNRLHTLLRRRDAIIARWVLGVVGMCVADAGFEDARNFIEGHFDEAGDVLGDDDYDDDVREDIGDEDWPRGTAENLTTSADDRLKKNEQHILDFFMVSDSDSDGKGKGKGSVGKGKLEKGKISKNNSPY